MGTKPKVILRRKHFGISKIFTPKMTEKSKLPDANFLVSEAELPKEKHIENPG